MVAVPSILRIEAAALSSWPALKLVHDGSWLRRFAAGHTRRANSLNCLDPADGGRAAERLAAHVSWSRALEIPPVVRVTPLTPPELVAVLDAQDWDSIDRSLVLAGPLPVTAGDAGVRAFELRDPEVVEIQARLSGHGPATSATLGTMLAAVAVEARAFAAVDQTGTPVATAFATVCDGIAGLFNVATAADARRRGHARRVLAAAFHWASGRGARHAAIQVQADNAAAVALYASFGLRETFSYAYRRAPAANRPETAS